MHLRFCPLPSLLRAILVVCISSLPLLAQSKTPTNPVAVENTNAAFVPTHEDTPVASPARPTVTAPAHIPPTGYLQFEQGFNQASDSPAGVNRQFALSQTTKIALTTRLLTQFITQPYTSNGTSTPGIPGSPNLNAPGDLDLGAQYILHKSVGPVPVVAAGFLRRVRSGTSANLDVGDFSQEALLLLSGDLPHGLHYDANLIINEQNNGPIRRPQLGQSLALSHPLFAKSTHGRLGGVAELSHFTQPFVTASVDGTPIARANTAGLLFAAVYAARPNLVLDWAFDHGLTSTSTQWQGSFGFTYLLPHRLWRDRHPIPAPVGPYHYRNSR